MALANPSTSDRDELIAPCMDETQMDQCITFLSDLRAEHQRIRYSSELLSRVENAAVERIARTNRIGRLRDVLEFAYSRDELKPARESVLQDARSAERIDQYRAILYLHYLSNWGLSPKDWDVMAEILLDRRKPDLVRELALQMIVDHPDRGSSNLTDVFLKVIRQDPSRARSLAKVLGEIRPHIDVVVYAEDRTLPTVARAGWIRGSADSIGGTMPPSEFVRILEAFARSDIEYDVRQSAADALKSLNQPRPWRTLIEDKRLHDDLRWKAELALLFAPAVFMLFGWVVLKGWLVVVWVLLSVWLTLLYIGLLGAGIAHSPVPYGKEIVAAIAITCLAQITLCVIGLRLRRNSRR